MCKHSSKTMHDGKIDPKVQIESTSSTSYHHGTLLTIEHDGHMFVIEGGVHKGAIIHHPSCKCRFSE